MAASTGASMSTSTITMAKPTTSSIARMTACGPAPNATHRDRYAMSVFKRWLSQFFADPQAVILAMLLVVGFAIVIVLGDMLAPVLAAIVLAYLLEGLVRPLERRGLPRLGAVLVVFSVFLALLLVLLFGLMPRVSAQATALLRELPVMIAEGQALLMQLPERYPQLISAEQIGDIMASLRANVTARGHNLLSLSRSTLTSLFTVVLYLVLLPVLVFFMLKDKRLIIVWLTRLLPQERALATQVWQEMDQQLGNYVRGKAIETFIVGAASYVAFALMGLNYATLLAVLVGLSVIVPYVGAIIVTVPVVLVAFFQWGWGDAFIWLVTVYLIIQGLDGNLLVPLLFSEAVHLHPVAIITAILLFGGIWGFWGMFFAIPLATLVKAVIDAWPRAVDRNLTLP